MRESRSLLRAGSGGRIRRADPASIQRVPDLLSALIACGPGDRTAHLRITEELQELADAWEAPAQAAVARIRSLLAAENLDASGFAEVLAACARLPGVCAGDADAIAGVDPQQCLEFANEAQELLSGAEAQLLAQGILGQTEVEAVFRAFHTVKSMAAYLGFTRTERLAHRLESDLLPVRDGVVAATPSVRAGALAGIDGLRAMAQRIRSVHGEGEDWPAIAGEVARTFGFPDAPAAQLSETMDQEALTEALVESGVPREVVEATAADLKPGEDLTTRLVRAGRISKTVADEVVAKQQEQAGKVPAEAFTRVSLARLEELVNLVGELLIAQSMVNQDEDVVRSPRLQATVARQNRIVRDLQNLSLGMRMVPLKATFQKMARAVHDTARKLGKQIEFRLVGEDTEIDRTIAEALADPLLHMVRNAVDHGIEANRDRLATGKAEKGLIILEARQASDQVIISLQDDGRGMDPAKLIAKAVEKGLLKPGQQLAPAESYQLIFAAGFSTAEQVTGISGRGVGMDVVRRNVEQLQGKIDIDSRIGAGSTFTIRLPLTTAILDAMLLRVGSERFLVPVTAIIASLRPLAGQVQEIFARGRMIENRGAILPLAILGEVLGLVDYLRDPTTGVVMVIEHSAGRYALLVDEILGLQQVVIKPLDHQTPHHPGLAGTAILGDGRVGLIIDPARLLI
jgi:two-component system, chemotaxis family, sensor kinase CheA